jgi:AAA domain, putative AbiEii toxin, Type IV TA system
MIASRDEARTAAEIAGRAALDGVSILRAVGSEPWRLMFDYAREYMAIAEPDRAFPDDTDDAVCPLCQQPLGPGARDRFVHFAEFLAAESQAHLADVSQRLEELQRGIGRIAIPTALDVSALRLVDPEDAPALADISTELQHVREGLEERRAVMATLDAPVADLPVRPNLVQGLEGAAAQLALRAEGLRAAARDETRPALLARLEELRALAGFDRDRDAIERLRAHLEMVAALRRCRSTCDTTLISRKNSELRDRYLTAEFDENFRDELAQLGLETLAVHPAGRTEHGENLVSIALDAAMRVRVRAVLSDGEIRAVGLAGFFADCRRIGANPPIVLDDPVSSLDHHRIRAVAHRLVDEARRRQVIVFTHSILLLWELWERATAQRVSLMPHWLRVEAGVPGGLMENTVPWEATGVRSRLGQLEQRLADARRIGDRTGDEYRRAVRIFYGDLRDTWERLVEELLFNGVIGRYTPGVQTQRLRMVEVTDEDFWLIDQNMTRTSMFEHSQAAGREQALPSDNEMRTDLQAMRDFSESIRRRLQEVDARRRRGQQPPPGTLASGDSG